MRYLPTTLRTKAAKGVDEQALREAAESKDKSIASILEKKDETEKTEEDTKEIQK
jgi:hypothetical protein